MDVAITSADLLTCASGAVVATTARTADVFAVVPFCVVDVAVTSADSFTCADGAAVTTTARTADVVAVVIAVSASPLELAVATTDVVIAAFAVWVDVDTSVASSETNVAVTSDAIVSVVVPLIDVPATEPNDVDVPGVVPVVDSVEVLTFVVDSVEVLIFVVVTVVIDDVADVVVTVELVTEELVAVVTVAEVLLTVVAVAVRHLKI